MDKIFLVQEHILQRKQGMQEGQTEKEEMRQLQRMAVMTREQKEEEWTQIIVGGSVSCWPLTPKKSGSIQNGKTVCKKMNDVAPEERDYLLPRFSRDMTVASGKPASPALAEVVLRMV